MASRTYFGAVALMLLVSTLVQAAAGATIAWTEDASLGPVDAHFREDLTSMLRRAPFHEARVFEVARKHIQEMESSPACHQLATSTLIDSCQSFSSLPGQDSTRTTDHSLDEVRQGYAARLAVCELHGIKSGIPPECAPFVPSRKACSRALTKGFFSLKSTSQEEDKRTCYPEFTPQQLKKCVDSLFDHAQRWTSYSNAQTNAIVICQASRGAMENEEHLQKLKEAVESQASVSETLGRVVHETEDRLAQHQEFARAVQQFQYDLTARNEATLGHADNVLARLVGKFDSATEALFGILTQAFKTTTDKANILSSNIQAANGDVDKARAALQVLHDDAVLREGKRAAAQDLALRESQNLVTDVQSSLENVRDITILALAERLQGVEETVINYLDVHEQALRDQQIFQEAQTRIMHNQNAIQTTLITQYELIEEKTQKIRDLAVGGLGGTIATYIGLTFCIILLSWANLVLGVAAAMGVGVVGALGSTTVAHVISLDGLTLTPFKFAVFRFMAWTLAFTIATISIVLVVLVGSLLARRLFVSHANLSMILDIEAPKRQLFLDDF